LREKRFLVLFLTVNAVLALALLVFALR